MPSKATPLFNFLDRELGRYQSTPAREVTGASVLEGDRRFQILKRQKLLSHSDQLGGGRSMTKEGIVPARVASSLGLE